MSAWVSALRRPQVRRRLAAAGILPAAIALAAVYWTALRTPAVGAFHDDGIYAVTAKALATGRGYRILSLPGENRQTKYPFLFPALLAAVWKMAPRFPDNVVFLKSVPLACAILWWFLSYQLIRRETRSRHVAAAVTLLTAVSPWILFLSTALLSETLFAALVTGALLLIRQTKHGEGSLRSVWGAGLAAGAACLTRAAGIALIPAGAWALSGRGKRRDAVIFILLASAACLPWVRWQLQHSRAPIESYYSERNYAAWNILLHFAPSQKLKIAGQNAVGALVAPGVLMGSPASGWGALGALLLGVLTVAGLVRRIVRKPGVIELFTIFYSTLIILWAWPPMRFFAPLLPVLLLYAYEGVKTTVRVLAWGPRAAQVLLACSAIAVAAQSGWVTAAGAAQARVNGSLKVPNTSQDDWREMARLTNWLQRNTPPDAVLMGNLDPVLYLYSGRKSVRGFTADPFLLHYSDEPDGRPLGTARKRLQEIQRYRVTYLVSTPNAAFREGAYLSRLDRELVTSHPELFRLVYESNQGRYRIYATALDRHLDRLGFKPNFQNGTPLITSNQIGIRVTDRN